MQCKLLTTCRHAPYGVQYHCVLANSHQHLLPQPALQTARIEHSAVLAPACRTCCRRATGCGRPALSLRLLHWLPLLTSCCRC